MGLYLHPNQHIPRTNPPMEFPSRCSRFLTPFIPWHKVLEKVAQLLSCSTEGTKLWLRCHHDETRPAAEGTDHPQRTWDKQPAFPSPTPVLPLLEIKPLPSTWGWCLQSDSR